MAINPDKNAVEQGLIARLIGKIKRIALDMGDSVTAETSRAQAAEAAAKTEVVQGENCTIEKTTAADGHDVYTVNADGKPQVQADWAQNDSSAVDYIKNRPQNLVQDANYVHTDNNFTTAEKNKLGGIESGAQVNVIEKVKVNGTEQGVTDKAVDISVPTESTATPLKDGTASAGSSSQWARGDHRHPTDDSREAVANKVQSIDDSSTTEYPSSKAVADFVNSSVATNTATFLGNFKLTDLGLSYPATEVQIAAALNSHTWPTGFPTNNDYVYVEIQDPQSTIDDKVQRYKYRDVLASWGYEYTLNNSSFTAEEKAAIDSGITSQDVTNLRADHTTLGDHVGDGSIHVTSSEKNAWNGKYTKPSTGIPKTDLASDVQTSLGKADSALQSHQSVTDNNPTLAWGATSKVGSVGSTDLQVTMPANPANNKQSNYLSVYGNTDKFIKLFRVYKFTAGSSIGTTVELIGRAGGSAVRVVINIKGSITADYIQFYDYAGDTSHYFTLYVAQDPDNSSRNLVYAFISRYGALYVNAADTSAGDTDLDFSVFGAAMSGRISGDTAITLRNMQDASWINSGTFDAARIPTSLPNTSIGGSAGAVTSIGEGQSNAARHVWFSDANDETKRVHNSNFTYNPVGNIISANISGNANGSAAYTNFIYDGESAGQRGSGQKVRMYGIDNTNNAYQSWYKVATIKKKSQTNYTSARLVGTLFTSGSNCAANINNAIHLQILFNFVAVTHKVYHTPNPNVKSLIRIVEINNNDTYELQIRPQALSNYSNFRLYIWDDQNNNVTVSFASGAMGEAASNGTVIDNYQIDPYYGRLANEAVGNYTTPIYVDSDGQVKACDPSLMSVLNASKASAANKLKDEYGSSFSVGYDAVPVNFLDGVPRACANKYAYTKIYRGGASTKFDFPLQTAFGVSGGFNIWILPGGSNTFRWRIYTQITGGTQYNTNYWNASITGMLRVRGHVGGVGVDNAIDEIEEINTTVPVPEGAPRWVDLYAYSLNTQVKQILMGEMLLNVSQGGTGSSGASSPFMLRIKFTMVSEIGSTTSTVNAIIEAYSYI